MYITIEVSGNPVPKPRMTRRDKWLDPPRPAVARYRKFKADIMEAALLAGYRPGIHDILTMQLDFVMKIPESWSKKAEGRMRGEYHRQVPDLDNLIKGIADALTDNDSGIYRIDAVKRWAVLGPFTRIIIEVADNG